MSRRRISGFFRDAFPQLIELIDQAVNAVIALDEPLEQNFVRKHYLAELAAKAAGSNLAQVERSARYRVFGSKPGTYGAGILPLINEKNWQDEADFAEAYVNWGGYAYTAADSGVDAREEFRERLTSVEVALHNQDNREHDIFDSDDYLQFHGGLIATIRSLTGRKPRHYFGDTQNPDRAVVRDLKRRKRYGCSARGWSIRSGWKGSAATGTKGASSARPRWTICSGSMPRRESWRTGCMPRSRSSTRSIQ